MCLLNTNIHEFGKAQRIYVYLSTQSIAMKEIEYKFLVDASLWETVEKPNPDEIVQGFIFKSPEKTIRVRIKNQEGFLTIKGKAIGISRDEFEYPIPYQDAKELLEKYTDKQLRKKRYVISFASKKWEVDVFEGALQGLILAELEVASEDEVFTAPPWITEDVSTNPAYFNSVLIDRL